MTGHHRRRRPDGDRGAISVFLAVLVPGLLLIIGLAVDGGAKDAVAAAGEQAGAASAATEVGEIDATALGVGDDPLREVDRALGDGATSPISAPTEVPSTSGWPSPVMGVPMLPLTAWSVP